MNCTFNQKLVFFHLRYDTLKSSNRLDIKIAKRRLNVAAHSINEYHV